MSPLRKRSRRRVRGSSALLLALGALTGLAVGVVLADRTGGIDALFGARRRRPQNDRPDGDAAMHDESDDADYGEDEHEAMFVSRGDHDATGITDDEDDDDDADDEPDDDGARVNERAAPLTLEMRAVADVPDDATLEERVLEAFHNDPVLAERAIDIGAIGTGVIELTGWVQASWEIGHAVTLARGVPDVTTVVDRLAVRDGERRRDHSGRHYAGPAPSDLGTDSASPRAD